MEEQYEIRSVLSQQCLGPVNMLCSEALDESWSFGHLSSYFIRS